MPRILVMLHGSLQPDAMSDEDFSECLSNTKGSLKPGSRRLANWRRIEVLNFYLTSPNPELRPRALTANQVEHIKIFVRTSRNTTVDIDEEWPAQPQSFSKYPLRDLCPLLMPASSTGASGVAIGSARANFRDEKRSFGTCQRPQRFPLALS